MKLKEIITGSDNTFEQSVTSKPSASASFSNWLINTAKEHPYLMLTAATAAVATGGVFFYYSFYKKADSKNKSTIKRFKNTRTTIDAARNQSETPHAVLQANTPSTGAARNQNETPHAVLQANTLTQSNFPKLKQISVGKNKEIWGINNEGKIWRFLKHSGWENIPGIFKGVSIGPNGEVWVLDLADRIFRYVGKQKWEQIPGSLKQISVGMNGEVWGVNAQDAIYRYLGDKNWEQIPGSLKQISVGMNGEVWGVNAQDAIYRYLGNKKWEQIPGALRQISVGAEGEIWGINSVQKICRYVDKSWHDISNSSDINYLSVGPFETYGLDNSGNIFCYSEKNWETFTHDMFLIEDESEDEGALILKDIYDIDEEGLTTLHRATAEHNLEKILQLLAAGADPNVVSQNSLGVTSIFYAVSKEEIALLVKYGALVNFKERGDANYTPLHRAVERQQEEQILFLLAFGADINENRSGHGTPLHTAAYHCLAVSAKLLVECGADRGILNLEKKTPAQFALDPAKTPLQLKQKTAQIISNTPINTARLDKAKSEGQRLLAMLSEDDPSHFDELQLLALKEGNIQEDSPLPSLLQNSVNSYRYVRFSPTKIRNDSSSDGVQLALLEIKYRNEVLSGATAFSTAASPPTERAEKIVDGNIKTKWFTYTKRATITLDFGKPIQMDGYTFATANDCQHRDPISWTLEGSNDRVTWQVLDTRTDYHTPTQRFTRLPHLTFQQPTPSSAVTLPETTAFRAPTVCTDGNWAVVRIWLPCDEKNRFVPAHEGYGKYRVGHASLQTPNFYASFWPEPKNSKSKLKNYASLHASPNEDEISEGTTKAKVTVYEQILVLLDVEKVDLSDESKGTIYLVKDNTGQITAYFYENKQWWSKKNITFAKLSSYIPNAIAADIHSMQDIIRYNTQQAKTEQESLDIAWFFDGIERLCGCGFYNPDLDRVPPDVIVTFYSLNLQAMKAKFEELQEKIVERKIKWEAHWWQCSNVVYELLKAGGIKQYVKRPPAIHILTAPDGVAYMALKAVKKEQLRNPQVRSFIPPDIDGMYGSYVFKKPLAVPDYKRYDPHKSRNRDVLTWSRSLFMSKEPSKTQSAQPTAQPSQIHEAPVQQRYSLVNVAIGNKESVKEAKKDAADSVGRAFKKK